MDGRSRSHSHSASTNGGQEAGPEGNKGFEGAAGGSRSIPEDDAAVGARNGDFDPTADFWAATQSSGASTGASTGGSTGSTGSSSGGEGGAGTGGHVHTDKHVHIIDELIGTERQYIQGAGGPARACS